MRKERKGSGEKEGRKGRGEKVEEGWGGWRKRERRRAGEEGEGRRGRGREGEQRSPEKTILSSSTFSFFILLLLLFLSTPPPSPYGTITSNDIKRSDFSFSSSSSLSFFSLDFLSRRVFPLLCRKVYIRYKGEKNGKIVCKDKGWLFVLRPAVFAGRSEPCVCGCACVCVFVSLCPSACVGLCVCVCLCCVCVHL